MSRQLRNVFIASILAVLALAAGIKGYVHNQYKTNIDNALISMHAFAQIKYSDLSTSLINGEVILENVRVSTDLLPGELKLGTITFETPGLAFMIRGPASVKSGHFPDHLGLAINNFTLDLNDELSEWIDALVKRMQVVYASERKICGGKSIFGPAEYKEMGYGRILSNMHMAYDFNKSKKTLNLTMSSDTRNMASFKATASITGIDNMSSNGMMQSGFPKLENVEVIFKDETYVPRMLKFCANLSNMKTETFINAEVKQSNNYFNMVWGFAPGPGLREAYKDFLLKPDTVTLSMRPNKEFNPIMAQSMSMEGIIEALNVRLKVNDVLVHDLSFKLPSPEFTVRHQKRLANSINFESLLSGGPIEPAKPVAPIQPKVVVKGPAKYHVISLANVSKHVSDFVIITTRNGNIRKGQLLRLDAANLYVQKRVHSGKFTMTVPRAKIKKIEAYYSK